MPDIKKLAIGESHTFTVVHVKEVATGKWPEYHWLGADGVTVATPKAAADRALEKRLKMTLETVTGETITIHRAPNLEDAAKSWWNFDIGSKADLKPAAVPKRLTGPTAVPGDAPRSNPDAPPPDDADAPEPIDYPVGGPTVVAGQPDGKDEPASVREREYYALARRVARVQKAIAVEHDTMFDLASVNAMCFSIMGGQR